MFETATNDFDLVTPGRIHFGWGRLDEVGPYAAELGRRAFLVCGSRRLAADGAVERLHGLLADERVELVELATVGREPEVSDVDRAAEQIRLHRPAVGDLVIGLGGGSALDLAKAVAALATSTRGGSVVDYLEGVGRGWQIEAAPLPVLAIPTTSGTGSEATKNAVISSFDPPFKKSLRSNLMMPRIALVDPQLTVSLPRAVTAHAGMDAITQLIESYVTRKTSCMVQALAVEGLRLALPALETAYADGGARRAREAMAQAALLSGMALANSGLGLAHGVAAALGVHCRVPHGLACAVMLPVALAVNRAACEAQFAELARAVGLAPQGNANGTAADALEQRVQELGRRLCVPGRLSELGVKAAQIPALVRDSRGNSMSGNPRSLSDDELAEILEQKL